MATKEGTRGTRKASVRARRTGVRRLRKGLTVEEAYRRICRLPLRTGRETTRMVRRDRDAR